MATMRGLARALLRRLGVQTHEVPRVVASKKAQTSIECMGGASCRRQWRAGAFGPRSSRLVRCIGCASLTAHGSPVVSRK